MNPVNSSKKSSEPVVTSSRASKKSLVQETKLATQTAVEARKTTKAIREAQEIKDQLRSGKTPKSFEQGIKEL